MTIQAINGCNTANYFKNFKKSAQRRRNVKADTATPSAYARRQNKLDRLSTEEKLNAFGIKTDTDKNGNLVLSEYRQPAKGISFKDIGINEDELLKQVSEIKGNADFTDSDATSTGAVEVIGGDIILKNHKLENTGKLAHIAGSRECDNSNYMINFEVKYEIW